MPSINDQPVPHADYGRTVARVQAAVATIPAQANEAVVVNLTIPATTIRLSSPLAAFRRLDVIVVQDAAGGRTVTWDPAPTWLAGTPPTLLATAGARTRVKLLWDGAWFEDGLGNTAGLKAAIAASATLADLKTALGLYL